MSEEWMVSRGMDFTPRREPHPQDFPDAAREDVGQYARYQPQSFIERPYRDVPRPRSQQGTQRDFGAGVCPQNTSLCREASRLAQVGQQGALVVALLGAAVELG